MRTHAQEDDAKNTKKRMGINNRIFLDSVQLLKVPYNVLHYIVNYPYSEQQHEKFLLLYRNGAPSQLNLTIASKIVI